jgi:uncharacterized protein YwbE
MATIDYYRRKRFINTLVEGCDLEYVENSKIKTPCTDGKRVMMPVFDPLGSELETNNWMAALIHECYHNMGNNRDDFNTFDKHKVSPDTALGMALNIVVDHNIENKENGKFGGADEYTRDSYTHLLPPIKENISTFEPVLGALLSFDVMCRSKWLGTVDYNFQQELNAEGQEAFAKLLPFKDKYLQGRDGGDPNYELTLELLAAAGSDTDKLKEDSAAKYEESGKGEESKSSGKDSDSEGKEGKGESDLGEADLGEAEARAMAGKGKESEGESDEVKETIIKYKDIVKHQHDSKGGVRSKIAYDADDLTQYRGYRMDTTPAHEVCPSHTSSQSQGLMESTGFTLSSKLRNVLKVMSQAKYKGGKKKGKIKSKAISSVITGNDRIFKKKEVADVLDTAVYVLIDASGSMECYGADKWEKAKQSALMMNDCLNKLNIPVEIGTFTSKDWTDVCRHTIITPFGTKSSNDSVAGALTNHPELCDNNDGESILWAHDRLIRQKQKRKVLIVLSDGQPHGKNYAAGFTRKVIKDIETKSPVQLHGIGIEDSSVEDYYTNHSVIKNASELEQTLLTTLKKSLT